MKLLILNGPNLNLLGLREPDIYGRQNYAALVRFCEDTCRDADISCKVFQSNHEGAIVDAIQAAYGTADGIVKPDYAKKAAETYANAELHLIDGGAHGFNRRHDAEAIRYLTAFAAL